MTEWDNERLNSQLFKHLYFNVWVQIIWSWHLSLSWILCVYNISIYKTWWWSLLQQISQAGLCSWIEVGKTCKWVSKKGLVLISVPITQHGSALLKLKKNNNSFLIFLWGEEGSGEGFHTHAAPHHYQPIE